MAAEPNVTRNRPGQRRPLVFDELSQVVSEVHRLVPSHDTVGNWTLAQICQHLADSFDGSIDGFDLSVHRLKRFFIHRQMLNRALTKGIPPGYTVNENLSPPPSVELKPAVDALARAIGRYESYHGDLHAHPLFGRLRREMWDRVHRVHAAHHLSFAIAGAARHCS